MSVTHHRQNPLECIQNKGIKISDGDLYSDRTQRFMGLLLSFIMHTRSPVLYNGYLSLYLQSDKICV
jgi:hypothetical protein